MTALYRDAFRRIIEPWLTDSATGIADLLAPNSPERVRAHLARFQIGSISESFDVGLLLKASDLHGIPRPLIFGPDPQRAVATYETLSPDIAGCLICEDIVGTGKQAGKILRAIEERAPDHWRFLFVPLIAFESGLDNLRSNYGLRTIVRPEITLPRTQCLTKDAQAAEPEVFQIRAWNHLTRATAARVMERADQFDDPPGNPFASIEDTGGIIVTCHNAPNNTLPLIHHKAPAWDPLFRRLHHKERAS